MQDVNFINQFLGIRRLFYKDKRIRPTHRALYDALFVYWNSRQWENPFMVVRDELMRHASIGSVNTYTKCMHELNKWGYLRYMPSSSPHIPSMVEMYVYDRITPAVQSVVKSDTAPDGSPVKNETGADDAPAPDVRPEYINNTNNPNRLKQTAEHPDPPGDDLKNATPQPPPPAKKSGPGGGGGMPEDLGAVVSYFVSLQSTAREAEKFFYHFESNHWEVSGSPVKNWHAAARKWIINAEEYTHKKSHGPQPGSLATPAGKKKRKKYGPL